MKKTSGLIWCFVLAGALLFQGCAFLSSDKGQNYIEGRIESLSFLILKELPDEAVTIQAAADAVSQLTSGEDISVAALLTALENTEIDELNTVYAPLIVNEIVDHYNLIVGGMDLSENENYETAVRTLNTIANGLKNGLAQWETYARLHPESL
tara:strand:- start:49357 stop:49815 length:459 start_codon:yes stop_codon:yes gene_type:complete